MHETVEATVHIDDVGPRAQHQVKSVAQNDVRAEPLQLLGRHRLYRAVGSDRHERRSLYESVRGGQAPQTRGTVGRKNVERGSHGPDHEPGTVKNMASP